MPTKLSLWSEPRPPSRCALSCSLLSLHSQFPKRDLRFLPSRKQLFSTLLSTTMQFSATMLRAQRLAAPTGAASVARRAAAPMVVARASANSASVRKSLSLLLAEPLRLLLMKLPELGIEAAVSRERGRNERRSNWREATTEKREEPIFFES